MTVCFTEVTWNVKSDGNLRSGRNPDPCSAGANWESGRDPDSQPEESPSNN